MSPAYVHVIKDYSGIQKLGCFNIGLFNIFLTTASMDNLSM